VRILTTGVLSGFGKAVHERFGGEGLAFTRPERERELDRARRFAPEVIIHCAANPARDMSAGDLLTVLEDNVLLTRDLTKIPHRKFIFLSSIDVYAVPPGPHREDTPLDPRLPRNLYATTKMLAEAAVRLQCSDHVIVRSSAMLGRHARRNALMRMLEENPCRLTLSGESSFYYVLYEDLLDFLAAAMDRGLRGTYNAAAAAPVTLAAAAERLGKTVSFGDYRYGCGTIDNSRIVAECPAFRKTSLDAVEEFLKQRV